jgi:NitT/TauT family transport system substrate-binding protein
MSLRLLTTTALLLLGSISCASAQKTVLRVGHFPNITHAQGLVGHYLTDQKKGWFEERLGPDVKIEWYVYNAGPSAMEAIFAGSLDLTYVGPAPVINAYAKSKGEEIRVIAGSATGGAALIVQPDGGITKPADFKGKKIATPQYGNTQDVAARVWLKKQGFKVTQLGGDVFVLPTQNPDQLALFARKELDAVWTVEPWLTRLELESGGKIFLEQKEEFATVLASSVKLLKDNASLVKKFAAAHAELTEWINKNPDEAKKMVAAEIEALTKAKIKPEIVDKAWGRIIFTPAITLAPLKQFVEDAESVGFSLKAGDLSKLVEIPK